MSTCRFGKGEMVQCVDPDQFGNFLQGRLYKIVEDYGVTHDYLRITGEDSKVRSMFRSRFVRVTQKEFTDEEYERLLV